MSAIIRYISYVKSGKKGPLPTISLAEIDRLKVAGHAVHIHPRKGTVAVDGFRTFRLAPVRVHGPKG